MALIRWTPRDEMDVFARDPFFRRFFDLVDENSTSERAWHPALDLIEEKDRLVVHLEMPGVDPAQVQVQLQEDLLTVHGERKSETRSELGKVLKSEHAVGAFTRSVQLPYRVQNDKVKASYRNGIMTITLPKAEEHVGRQIPVEVVK